MLLYASCMCCILNKQEQMLRDYPDEEKKSEYMKSLMRLIGESEKEDSAPWLSGQISKMYEEHFGEKVDFAPFKKKFNQLVLEREAELEERIRSAKDPLRQALLYARVGNYIDFAAMDDVDPDEFLRLFERDGDVIEETEYEMFCKELKQAESMVYLLDNCGEIVLDKLVMKILKEQYPKLQITAIVRGAEVVNDVTMEDAIETGLTEVVDVLGNGDDTGGTVLKRISMEAKECIQKANVILAKGQGNYESLHGCGLNIYYLFLCKCDFFMRKFNVERFAGMFINEKR